jgi:hypothetical protein
MAGTIVDRPTSAGGLDSVAINFPFDTNRATASLLDCGLIFFFRDWRYCMLAWMYVISLALFVCDGHIADDPNQRAQSRLMIVDLDYTHPPARGAWKAGLAIREFWHRAPDPGLFARSGTGCVGTRLSTIFSPDTGQHTVSGTVAHRANLRYCWRLERDK